MTVERLQRVFFFCREVVVSSYNIQKWTEHTLIMHLELAHYYFWFCFFAQNYHSFKHFQVKHQNNSFIVDKPGYHTVIQNRNYLVGISLFVHVCANVHVSGS